MKHAGFFLKFYFYSFICVCVCVCDTCVSACRDQQRVSDPLDLEFTGSYKQPYMGAGSELGSSEGIANILNCCAPPHQNQKMAFQFLFAIFCVP